MLSFTNLNGAYEGKGVQDNFYFFCSFQRNENLLQQAFVRTFFGNQLGSGNNRFLNPKPQQPYLNFYFMSFMSHIVHISTAKRWDNHFSPYKPFSSLIRSHCLEFKIWWSILWPTTVFSAYKSAFFHIFALKP